MATPTMTSHIAATSERANDAQGLLTGTRSFADHAPPSPFPVLPSYEEATGASDMSRLPSYRQSRPASRNYHPYLRRPKPALADSTGLERLLVRLPLAYISLRR